jgi:hypothetical protein
MEGEMEEVLVDFEEGEEVLRSIFCTKEDLSEIWKGSRAYSDELNQGA